MFLKSPRRPSATAFRQTRQAGRMLSQRRMDLTQPAERSMRFVLRLKASAPNPLTVSDYASRYLLLCEAMESVKEQGAFTAFERLFQERGLPQAIRSDNGVPFASPNALFNLRRLAVWLLTLGSTIDRIQPLHPNHHSRHHPRPHPY